MTTTFVKKGLIVGIVMMMCVSALALQVDAFGGAQVTDNVDGGSSDNSQDGGSSAPTTGTLQNPFKGGNSLIGLLRTVLDQIILPIGSVVVVLMIIYSGFLFVTAQGNDTKLSTAKNSFMWTIIGAAILLGAWTMGQVIQQTVCDISGRPLPGLDCGQQGPEQL